jgi:hypothetical protein
MLLGSKGGLSNSIPSSPDVALDVSLPCVELLPSLLLFADWLVLAARSRDEKVQVACQLTGLFAVLLASAAVPTSLAVQLL